MLARITETYSQEQVFTLFAQENRALSDLLVGRSVIFNYTLLHHFNATTLTTSPPPVSAPLKVHHSPSPSPSSITTLTPLLITFFYPWLLRVEDHGLLVTAEALDLYGYLPRRGDARLGADTKEFCAVTESGSDLQLKDPVQRCEVYQEMSPAEWAVELTIWDKRCR